MKGSVVALAVVAVGSVVFAGSTELAGVLEVGVLDVLDGDTPLLGVDVGSVFAAGVTAFVVVVTGGVVVVVGGGAVFVVP
ncbi:MAG: hypothetical protein WBQ21_01005 [Solirubrobacteraceae bacterium]